jgi:hypothetical protein
MTDTDVDELAALLQDFALATERGAPQAMAALMCADEAERFLDNVADPDAEGIDNPVNTPIELLGVGVFGDRAWIRFTRPYFHKPDVVTCRKESGRWTMCEDVGEELSLDQFEGDPQTTPDPVDEDRQHILSLRRRPVGQLTATDLKVLLSHGEGLTYLVPRVANTLHWEPLTSDGQPGELLLAVLGIDEQYWATDQISLVYVRSAAEKVDAMVDAVPDAVQRHAAAFLKTHPRLQ